MSLATAPEVIGSVTECVLSTAAAADVDEDKWEEGSSRGLMTGWMHPARGRGVLPSPHLWGEWAQGSHAG